MDCRAITRLLRRASARLSVVRLGWALLGCACFGCVGSFAGASEYHGQVTFGGVAVPGATVTAVQGSKRVVVISDSQGVYSFADLADGSWRIGVEMLCFAPMEQEVTVGPDLPLAKWELKLLPVAQIMAQATAVKAEPKTVLAGRSGGPAGVPDGGKPKVAAGATEPARPAEDAGPRPSDGLLINGSVSNAATSQFSMAPAFGNSRSSKSLYTGGLALILDNSALDARPYSLTGLETGRPSYNRVTAVFTIGGPIRIPHILPRGPNFFLAYQWTRDSDDTTLSGLVPSLAERSGNLAAGQVTPVSQAVALLNYYPLPNILNNSRYNYQTAVLGATHRDALQSRLDKTIGRKNQFYGGFAFQDSRVSAGSLLGFVDKTDTLGITTNVNWVHRFNQRTGQTIGYRLSRQRVEVTPNFQNRVNVSGLAGIHGNDQDEAYWGPPTLQFSSGIASLSDAQSSFNRNRTDGVSYALTWSHRSHNVSLGGDFRRQEFNVLSQQDPRGTFGFTGAATQGMTGGGSDFADFLRGVPDTSEIAFGNADKYLRQSVYDAFATDDWRIRPELTINAGLRWEYGAPITELKNRLVNLDIASGYSAVAPLLASNPVGSLTGTQLPSSLVKPDRLGVEPRVGISWRPIPGSTLVVRSGYGVYDDTSVYEATALLLAQQAPLSKSLSVQNSVACPLTLANGFNSCSTTTADTFAVDPNFRVGYAQTWQLSAQRDLPGALVATASYLGIKGTRGVQEYLPNTNPIGAVNPCPACPLGYVYRASNGNSKRESGSLQVRRRLRSGFTASALYTFSKSVDDDAVLGGQGPVAVGATAPSVSGAVIAQDWRNLAAERGRSSFDQRHLLNVTFQYTSGQGLGGGTLLGGWRGTLLKEWTALGTIVAGSGLPETPIYFAAVPGTSITNSIRPNLTGASLYSAPVGFHLSSAAYSAPTAGQWGNAARNSINGPGQFTFNASLARTFRLKDHYNLDLRVDSTNLLNHVVFTNWNNVVNGATFGLPAAADAMRSLQTTLRLRY